jgi:hypothetical protein
MGEVLATLSSPRDYITEPDIAEAIAALRAAYLCQELGFYRVILKGDALKVVQALKKGDALKGFGASMDILLRKFEGC